MTPADQIDQFLKGQQDCKKGVPHKDKNPDYTRGYRVQYELEQLAAERSERNARPNT